MKRFKLNALETKELENVKGGYKMQDCGSDGCGCGCYYEGNGGSSTDGNFSANKGASAWSPYRGDTIETVPC